MRKISFIFIKILLLFLLVILPIYFTSIYINYRGQKELEAQTIQAVMPKMEFYASRFEREINLVRSSLMKLHLDKDLQYLSTVKNQEGNYQQVQAMLHLRSRLQEIKELSDFTYDLSLYVPMVHKKISNAYIMDYDEEEFLYINQGKDEAAGMFVTVPGAVFVDVVQRKTNAEDMVMIIFPFFSDIVIDGIKLPQYMMTIRLEPSSLNRVLQELSDNTNGHSLLMTDGKGLNFYGDSMAFAQDIRKNHREIFDNPSKEADIGESHIGTSNYVLLSRALPSLDSTLLTYIPQKTFFKSLERYRIWFWTVTLLTLVLAILFTLLVRLNFIQPLNALIAGFSRVEKGVLDIDLHYEKHDEFSYLYLRFNEMCRRLSTLIDQAYKQKILMQRSELKQLQYQINPHFLYNSLFIIYRMAKIEDNEGIVKMSQHLGNYYQFVTKNATEEVSLEMEMSHVEDYIQIQSIRYAERIRVHFPDLTNAQKKMSVPRLILQPLVENAYNHGLHRKTENGEIWITVQDEAGALKITVEDNGEGMEDDLLLQMQASLADSNGSELENALMNIHRRLMIRYGPESGIFSEHSVHGGLRVEIRIVKAKEVPTA